MTSTLARYGWTVTLGISSKVPGGLASSLPNARFILVVTSH